MNPNMEVALQQLEAVEIEGIIILNKHPLFDSNTRRATVYQALRKGGALYFDTQTGHHGYSKISRVEPLCEQLIAAIESGQLEDVEFLYADDFSFKWSILLAHSQYPIEQIEMQWSGLIAALRGSQEHEHSIVSYGNKSIKKMLEMGQLMRVEQDGQFLDPLMDFSDGFDNAILNELNELKGDLGVSGLNRLAYVMFYFQSQRGGN